METLSFVILALAIYRLTVLLVYDSGPFFVMDRFRAWAGIRYDALNQQYLLNEFARGLACGYCVSLWVALVVVPLYLLFDWFVWLCLPFALSAVTVILEAFSDGES